jgi:hypothetical protein
MTQLLSRVSVLESLASLSWRPLDKVDRMGLGGVESPTARIAETANELYILDGNLLAIINVNTNEETHYELNPVYP